MRAQEVPDIRRLLAHAQEGRVEDQLKLGHAFQFGLGVQRDASQLARDRLTVWH